MIGLGTFVDVGCQRLRGEFIGCWDCWMLGVLDVGVGDEGYLVE